MFFLPAHLFNRAIILVPLAFCVLIGAVNYDSMLTQNGFEPRGDQISQEQRLAYGLCLFFLYGICLLLMLCCTQLMKYGIKRERPKRR